MGDEPSWSMIGSSPLARGTRDSTDPMASLHAVHPRWRGEHVGIHGPALSAIGSSPLARGTLGYAAATHPDARFIPAGAGNTH